MGVELHVYDKAYKWQGTVGEFDGLRATRAHLAVGDAEFTTPSDLDLRAALAAPGARVVVSLDGEQFVGGLVDDGGSFVPGSDVTYEVTDDYDLLYRILGWVVPGAPLSGQGTAEYWRTVPASVPAETALKAVLSENVTRLGLPVTVAPSLGRGSPLDLSYRFHPLPDRLLPRLAQSGIGVSVTVVEGQGLLVDCYVPTQHAIPLTTGDGVIVDGGWKRSRPTATRAVGAASGVGTARTFFGPVIDTALEAEFGFCGEVVIDARDTSDGTTVTQRMQAELASHGPKVSVSMTLTESADFSYGTYRVGDTVPVEYEAGTPPTTDVLTEATLTYSTSVPEPEVTFQLGERTDDATDATWRSIAAVAAGVRDLTNR